ncbi:DUF1579 domain-containing protein [Bosea psychrotolerans]|uniref:Uncharacterized protein DUF1579 n=1 Tax=Bosea psychrotolerans TaxID=1871628 RepID=A0A2S4M6R3_9HYPH|nr:DUF1579 domain-containing protein [Bosea psychrotolerans]POR50428.1 uncharacterized protein DUF1579 [Bosea psychrotolerans]
MKAEPQKEHEWLAELVGEWATEMDCSMGPDQPRQTFKGTESVRSLGGLWTLGEGRGEMPDGCTGRTLMTLGFDPAKGRFVGSFIGSMMTHQWLYDGALDETGTALVLDSEGPAMSGDGSLSAYRDIMTIVSPDHRILTSSVPDGNGGWTEFMTARYRRTG